MDFDFTSFFVGVAIGLGIAYAIIWLLGRMIYNKLSQEGILKPAEPDETESDSKRIDMKVERHGDVLYAFRIDDDGFVCQGADLSELRKNFIARFPGMNGSVEGKTEELHKELIEQKKGLKNEGSTSIGSAP